MFLRHPARKPSAENPEKCARVELYVIAVIMRYDTPTILFTAHRTTKTNMASHNTQKIVHRDNLQKKLSFSKLQFQPQWRSSTCSTTIYTTLISQVGSLSPSKASVMSFILFHLRAFSRLRAVVFFRFFVFVSGCSIFHVLHVVFFVYSCCAFMCV